MQKAFIKNTPFFELIKALPTQRFIKAVFEVAINKNYAVAAWQMPGKKEIDLIIDFSGECKTVQADLDELASGFLFAPYQQPEKPEGILIKADLHFTLGEGKSLDALKSVQLQQDRKEQFLEELKETLTKNSTTPFYPSDIRGVSETSQAHYVSITTKAIEKIQKGEFHKVVPSRTKTFELSKQFDLASQFINLSEAYPNAFISLISVPDIGTWMGATPEILVSVNHDKQEFQTVALAGTQFVSEETTLQNAAWRQKEIEEQAMVSRYIINCFKKIRLREFEEHGPKTVQAGNLLHLKTDFKVDMKATNFAELGTVMLNLLHPTSAVCGMPKQEAHAFLMENEGYNREFYSGFIGPVHMNQQSTLFVNLRCMQIGAAKAVLYAGAGVTEDSVPEKEWVETEMKCRTLLNVLEK